MHAYSWAIPDRRYAKWVKEMRPFFNFMSGLNIAFYLAGIFGGGYLYHNSKDGIKQFMGVSCIAYTLLSQSLMIIMFIVNHMTLSGRFDYENEPYHGHVDYPPKSDSQKTSNKNEEKDEQKDV